VKTGSIRGIDFKKVVSREKLQRIKNKKRLLPFLDVKLDAFDQSNKYKKKSKKLFVTLKEC
jgi:hypothetical protein